MDENDIIFKIFSIMGAVGGLSFLIFLIVKLSTQGKKARQINELRCGFEVHCGGQFDSITLSYPLVKIRLEETAIFIQYTGVSILLYIQDIKTVDIVGDLFMGGIKIEHNVNNFPKGIRLFTPYYKLLYKFISTRQTKN